jgi:hypothetical protein
MLRDNGAPVRAWLPRWTMDAGDDGFRRSDADEPVRSLARGCPETHAAAKAPGSLSTAHPGQ